MLLQSSLFIAAGGFCGAVSRYAVGQYVKSHYSGKLPMATWLINVLGSFLLGCLIGGNAVSGWNQFIGIGFMGAFTTFSTFKLEVFQLRSAGEWRLAIIYMAGSYTLGIGLAIIGYEMGRSIF